MIEKVKIQTYLKIAVWSAIGEEKNPWCYSVKIADRIAVSMGNNYETEEAAYKAALLCAAAYKSQFEA
jgi:hypothetical protein